MAVDWHLRDPTRNTQPMSGGIPDGLLAAFQWGSLVLLFIAVFLRMPRSRPAWVRALLAIAQAALAFLLMVFGWLYYVLRNGIDTL